MESTKIRISCDDGCRSDIRLAELCKKFNVECIFYWPVEWHSLAHYKGYIPLTYNEALDIAKDFEIGSHTITHRILSDLEQVDAEQEIVESQRILTKLFDRTISKFCPPRGYTNDILTDFTLKIYGSERLTKGEQLVHIHPNSGANDNKPWRDAINEDTKELWCHSYDLDKFNLWEELEEYLKNNENIPR